MRYLPVAMMLFAAVACSKVESRDVTLLSNELNVDGGCEIYTVEHAEAARWNCTWRATGSRKRGRA